ncbi:MAG: hypothetical protein BGO24_10915 [Sphingomonas sp. 67-36]|nr:MAG: hypothetical protein BGO24_10915 [Sphingomonas sp. 67-36]
MPASTIESPATSSAKCSPLPSNAAGTGSEVDPSNASIGTPAAMRPWSGISTTSFAGSGIARRGGWGALAGARRCSERSGIFTTSSARARLGRRRRKPRSSSALIRRCTPDLDFSSSASFISSNDGETPVSARRSWMKQISSCCFLVSIAILRRRTDAELLWNNRGRVKR